jgi:hypothetical protein
MWCDELRTVILSDPSLQFYIIDTISQGSTFSGYEAQ